MPTHVASEGTECVVRNGQRVLCRQDAPEEVGDEGYELRVAANAITLAARTDAGLFYGQQTLLQLLPPGSNAGLLRGELCVSLPPGMATALSSDVVVRDIPRYQWRGLMLDSGRQYQSVAFLKRTLEAMAFLKLNVFHWHLTEGLGWRVEIKRYPKLAEVGSKVGTLPEQQGYYTQDEIRDIVRYAAERHITVVPEIDMPGHAEAALAAYPEHTCFGNPPPPTGAFSHFLFCGGRESTYTFLTDVLEEVCDLFPSPYIHLGGDEAPKRHWNKCPDCRKRIADEGLRNAHELQIYMTNRLADVLQTRGRKAACWDDVVARPGPKLRGNIVVHWWNYRARKYRCALAAATMGHGVIGSPNYYCYLNFPVVPWSLYKANRTFDLRTMYERNPAEMIPFSPKQRAHYLGLQACLWTDGNVRENMIDVRVFPRLLALAEMAWRPPVESFGEFYARIQKLYGHLHARGVSTIGPALRREARAGVYGAGGERVVPAARNQRQH